MSTEIMIQWTLKLIQYIILMLLYNLKYFHKPEIEIKKSECEPSWH